MTAHDGANVLTDLAIILCVAAVTTTLFQRIRQPVVLGYLLAGLIVGPHVPLPLFASAASAHVLSELGVVLLMFSLGLEFNLRKLIRLAPRAGVVAVIECSLMIWLGYASARLMGWTGYESLFCGAMVAISSTTIVVKASSELGARVKLPGIVFGVLIMEDLVAVLLLAVLTPVASGAGMSPAALAATVAKLGGFLLGLLAAGMLIVPRLVRFIVRLGRAETTVVASIGICFAFALLAQRFGYSVALGAFLGGALVAESGEGKHIEHAIQPVRDMFGAVFFVSVGMLIEPRLILENWSAVLVLTAVVVVGKTVGIASGAFIAGHGVRASFQAGMSLAQIGEFSFMIAGLGLTLHAARDFLYAVAIAVSALTTLFTPTLIRVSGPVAAYVDRRLPHALQTYASLYGSWVQQLREVPQQRTAWTRIRRLAALLVLDLVIMAAIAIGASLGRDRLVAFVGRLGLAPALARWAVVAGALAVAGPFLFGAVRMARALGLALALAAFPSAGRSLDLAAAPRRALLVTLQLAILLVAGAPLVAVTQPFLPSFPPAAVLLVAAAALLLATWRSATNLQGHARAGAQVVLEALATQSQSPPRADTPLEGVQQMMPGLGDLSSLKLEAKDPCVGQSLKQLHLRGSTGATVLGIRRPQGEVALPNGDEILRAGDTVVLTGTAEAVAAARKILKAPPAA